MQRKTQTLPEGWEQVLYWRISGQTNWAIWINVLSVVLFAFWMTLFTRLAEIWGNHVVSFPSLFTLNGFGVLGGCLFILIFHEMVHGEFMWVFGAHPRFGILWKQMMIYATSPGYPFTRNQYILIALAPFGVISLASALLIYLLAGSPWTLLVALVAAINASGAIGDQWMAGIVLHYPPAAYVMDEKDGMRIFLGPHPENRPSSGQVVSSPHSIKED